MAGLTIREVARMAGVSTATVSRVINGNSRVDPAAAVRVRQAITTLGYVPNTVARSLKADKTMLVGLLISDIGNPYFSAMAKSLELLLGQQGYTLLIGSTDEGAKQEARLLDMMMGRKADGLILNTTGQNDPMIAAMSRRMPVVLVNRRVRHAGFAGDLVDSTNREGAAALAENLLSAGHRRIGLIHGDLSLSTGLERGEGFLAALHAHGLSEGPDGYVTYQGDFSMESGMAGANCLLSGPRPVTALAAMNNSMAMGALRHCRSHGIRIPEDVSLVAYGTLEDADLLYVRPTVVALSAREMAERAAEMLLTRMIQPDLPPRESRLNPYLVSGETVGPPRGAASL